jgi:hypothetical protein
MQHHAKSPMGLGRPNQGGSLNGCREAVAAHPERAVSRMGKCSGVLILRSTLLAATMIAAARSGGVAVDDIYEQCVNRIGIGRGH